MLQACQKVARIRGQGGSLKNMNPGGSPSGPVVKNLSSNAGDVGSIPGRGTKIPHAMGQLNRYATTTEPMSCSERPQVPQSNLTQPNK